MPPWPAAPPAFPPVPPPPAPVVAVVDEVVAVVEDVAPVVDDVDVDEAPVVDELLPHAAVAAVAAPAIRAAMSAPDLLLR
jgi:hypothetical protein